MTAELTDPSGSPLRELLDVLDLEQIDSDIFRGASPQTPLQRIFGGQVAGQAMVAAGRTAPADRPVHSLHAYFVRPGDPAVPVIYLVDRLRDGRSFTTRRVVAVQHGRPIFHLSASFHTPEPGLEHQVAMPDVPAPDTLPPSHELLAPYRDQLESWEIRPRPFELRYVTDPPSLVRIKGTADGNADARLWMRTVGPLPDDPLLHVCALTYASDMTLLDSVFVGHGRSWNSGGLEGASLDHAMWFHRPFRADDWLLYDKTSPSATGALGLATGRIFTADGQLAVSVVQEGLVRLRGD